MFAFAWCASAGSVDFCAARASRWNVASNRFRWEYQPGSDLFVVFSEGRDTFKPGAPDLMNRVFVVKFTRLFRF